MKQKIFEVKNRFVKSGEHCIKLFASESLDYKMQTVLSVF